MSRRVEFELLDEDYDFLMDACKPVPYLMIGNYVTPSQQENANAAWETLGEKLGFTLTTVLPVSGKSDRFFTAEKIGE